MRGLGINFRVRIQFGQALSRINLWIRETPLAAAAAAAAAVQADGQTAHWLHGENHCWVLAQVLPSNNEATLLPTCHLHQLCVDAPREGPKGRAGERRRLVLGAACMDAPRASSQPRPFPLPMPLHSRAPCLCLCLCQLPELPLPLQLLMVPQLSCQPLS